MKLTHNNRSSGMALLVVMIAVISLSILAGIYAHSMKVEARLAINSNNDSKLMWAGISGIEYVKVVLAEDMKTNGVTDTLQDSWATISREAIPMENRSGLDATVTINSVIDLEGRANINSANEEMLEQALVTVGVEPGEFPVIVNSILDWIDPDGPERPQGAEDDYYQSLEFPYVAKNGPIDDLGELLLIKGVTHEMYWGPAAGGSPPSRYQNNNRLGFNTDMPAYQVGLVNLFTPVSSGRININTAKPEVLQLIPFVDQHIATQIIQLRAGPDGAEGTEDDIPFRNAGELVNANLNPQAVQQAIRFCDVRSRTFEVKLTATVSGYSRDFVGVIVRNSPADLQTISFHCVERSPADQPAQ